MWVLVRKGEFWATFVCRKPPDLRKFAALWEKKGQPLVLRLSYDAGVADEIERSTLSEMDGPRSPTKPDSGYALMVPSGGHGSSGSSTPDYGHALMAPSSGHGSSGSSASDDGFGEPCSAERIGLGRAGPRLQRCW